MSTRNLWTYLIKKCIHPLFQTAAIESMFLFFMAVHESNDVGRSLHCFLYVLIGVYICNKKDVVTIWEVFTISFGSRKCVGVLVYDTGSMKNFIVKLKQSKSSTGQCGGCICQVQKFYLRSTTCSIQ